MEAKDLMIGDWVDFYHPYEPEKKIVTRHRVTDIYESCLDGLVGISNHNNPVHADHLEPVKITPEILENNGFNVRKYSDGECYADIMFEDQGRRVEIEYRYGVDIDVCVIGRNNTPPFSRIETQVRYIHELQHIFRIMQINKEIVF